MPARISHFSAPISLQCVAEVELSFLCPLIIHQDTTATDSTVYGMLLKCIKKKKKKKKCFVVFLF